MEKDFDVLLSQTENEECGYFKERKSRCIFTCYKWMKEKCKKENINLPLETEFADYLFSRGYRRSGSSFYFQDCESCSDCKPMRIPVEKFEPSKSQKVVWRKNADVEVRLEKNREKFVTDEKVFLLREYYNYHNGERKPLEEAKRLLDNLNGGYEGVWNLEFYIEGKLAGCSVLDWTSDGEGKIQGISSNYFYYDVSERVLKKSIGVFSMLKEIELCRKLGAKYYYPGLYISDCRKMNYKTRFKPYELFINEKWFFMPENPDACVNTKIIYRFPSPGFIPGYNDIVAVTENIDVQLLFSAYMQGIFPWFNEDEGEPVIWQCPEKRFVINLEELHVSKSIEKFLKHNPYTYTIDKCFGEVIENCSLQEREGQNGTWIGKKIKKSYSLFHKAGFAHSVEAWKDGKLAGGFYGELIGSMFFGESMFTIEPNSSKSAFVLFARAFKALGGKMIDCQAYTDNMARYGGKEIPRKEFLNFLKTALREKIDFEKVKQSFCGDETRGF